MSFPLLKAPFPWIGGKSRVADVVWDHFGDVRNYVEPFAGSLAVLLGRHTEPKIETVNDLDCFIANFWRALQAEPEQLAAHTDWPVNEADLHARHLWLVNQAEFRERMKMDPDYYDAKIAGWWVWGICQWIGSGWCAAPHSLLSRKLGRADGTPQQGRPCMNPMGVHADLAAKRLLLTGHTGSVGVHKRSLITPGRTNAGAHGRGILRETVHRKRPLLDNDNGRGVLPIANVSNQIPDLSGDSGAAGRAIHASGLRRKMPDMGGSHSGGGRGLHSLAVEESGIYEWFYALADRLRRVQVCCGDWKRVLRPAPTTCIGVTGVFLDPPYAVEERSDVYNEESRDLAHEVREWAIANGDNPDLRIALCGYEAEDYPMPDSWTEVAWKANAGYGNQANEATTGRQNAGRERIWFSPHCLQLQPTLFQPEDFVVEAFNASGD